MIDQESLSYQNINDKNSLFHFNKMKLYINREINELKKFQRTKYVLSKTLEKLYFIFFVKNNFSKDFVIILYK